MARSDSSLSSVDEDDLLRHASPEQDNVVYQYQSPGLSSVDESDLLREPEPTLSTLDEDDILDFDLSSINVTPHNPALDSFHEYMKNMPQVIEERKLDPNDSDFWDKRNEHKRAQLKKDERNARKRAKLEREAKRAAEKEERAAAKAAAAAAAAAADISIIEWFDKSVESELNKRRVEASTPKLTLSQRAGTSHHLIIESSACGIDIETNLRGELDTDLLDAVDNYAKAEAIVAFEGAVRAAEAAAASAPPELAEEAAVAGARGYQAELTSVVKQVLPGVRPLEVIGYVGITRPKLLKKPFKI